ncbi:NAD(P)/FAD-dependent oxidoreductase [Aridibaculum aurantiacum]|uniref:NAD(P)/FAD-dependent oxidoreductase n=1 Tax=Aridibaculum aurantiacum TaxID=2810307 RepID=UPI001A95E104|nr:FAD-dependent oxidoreductase [Aridibaculum aurantiacum]
MDVDYIIVGQGLCGTWLSYYLQKAEKKILVIDEDKPSTASKVASGVINPVTGRRIVRTWRIEELLPFAESAYKELGDFIEHDIISTTRVLDFHPTLQMQEAFEKRSTEEPGYLHINTETDHWKNIFHYPYTIGEISPCLLVDLNTMLREWRKKLVEKNQLLADNFSFKKLTTHEGFVSYDNIKAKKIFFCEGAAGFNNPFFYQLPYSHMKGEALIVSTPGLPTNSIYKNGFSIVPWEKELFWVGSSYEWKFEDLLPTKEFKERCQSFLQRFLKIPFSIVDHIAADRPANMERRPFVGLHPANNCIGILNGMGTKGCSLAPFFAKQLADHVISGTPIYPDADVKRFEKVLQKKLDK